jgi:hypothetical protein
MTASDSSNHQKPRRYCERHPGWMHSRDSEICRLRGCPPTLLSLRRSLSAQGSRPRRNSPAINTPYSTMKVKAGLCLNDVNKSLFNEESTDFGHLYCIFCGKSMVVNAFSQHAGQCGPSKRNSISISSGIEARISELRKPQSLEEGSKLYAMGRDFRPVRKQQQNGPTHRRLIEPRSAVCSSELAVPSPGKDARVEGWPRSKIVKGEQPNV